MRYHAATVVHMLCVAAVAFALSMMPAPAGAQTESAQTESAHWIRKPLVVPDVVVTDQDGRRHRFYTDLVKGRTVAISFVFTACVSVCPPVTAAMRFAQRELAGAKETEPTLLSISVDPLNDTPDRLKEFATRFDTGPGWHFLTGTRSDIDQLLKALGASAGQKDEDTHSPMLLIGNDRASSWTRLHGLAPPALIASTLREAAALSAKSDAPSTRHLAPAPAKDTAAVARAAYFTNLPLQTQDGRSVRFYDDVIRDRVVVIHAMFTGCTSVCPGATANLMRVQRALGTELAGRVHFVSITVDPLSDTPEVLKAFATRHGIGAAPDAEWTLLTGRRENVDWVLYKLGAFTQDKDEHTTAVLIGNDATGEWVKRVSMADPRDIAESVRRVARMPAASSHEEGTH